MEGSSFPDMLSAFWPVFVFFIGVVFALARSHTDIETLKEKVRVLYELYNKGNK